MSEPSATEPARTPLLTVTIPAEIVPGERRVAATPETVDALRKIGCHVVVQSGAGVPASLPDSAYAEAGAEIVADAEQAWSRADLVLKVRAPTRDEVALLPEGARLVSFIWPSQNPDLLRALAERRATVLAMDAMPRITRAQRMDALSAMANVVGYRAVIEAASHFGRFLPGQITAAGRVRPARVLVIGAGVAGLAAVAAARSLGAVVSAFDTRPAVREQVESLGASFLELQFDESGEGAGGYAKEMSEAYLLAEQALIAQHAKESDLIVCTALIPGKPAPQLVTSGAVVSMMPGSVIVDLAAEQGGNCALTERDQVVERYGVTVVGLTDLASRMAQQSSELYARTVLSLVGDVMKGGRGFELDLEDEIHRAVLVTHEGRVTWPPPQPPKPRAAAPPAPAPAAPAHRPAAHAAAAQGARGGRVVLALASVLLGLAGLFGPPEFLAHLTVFVLACVVGWHVVWEVTPALHTPLMSVTNAISGIILIGAMLVLSGGAGVAAVALGALAILLASINVAGGFLVTQRMLRMFRK